MRYVINPNLVTSEIIKVYLQTNYTGILRRNFPLFILIYISYSNLDNDTSMIEYTHMQLPGAVYHNFNYSNI